MNHPKLLALSSYRSKRFEESNLINFIQKLPHIVKEDKIQLRRKIKEKDCFLLEILKKHQGQVIKEDDDFKTLQATLRKYLGKFKTQAREEQINRYKNTIKSYRSSCQKPSNKQNYQKKGFFLGTKRFDKKCARINSPSSSLQKLNQLKNFKGSKPYQTQKLDNLKAKYSMQKDKTRIAKANIQLNPQNKVKSNKLLSSSSSKYLQKQLNFESSLNLKTQSRQTLNRCNTDRYLPSQSSQKKASLSFAPPTNLFTSPDLLQQCKSILQKAKQAPCFEQIEHSIPISPRYQTNTQFTSNYFYKQHKQIIQQQIKPLQAISFCKQQKSDSNLLENYNSRKLQQEQQNLNLQPKSAEFVFDYLFSDNWKIDSSKYSQIINKYFGSTPSLYHIFSRADTNYSGEVTIFDIGKYLIQTFGKEQNYVKDIFQLIDMDHKGYITQTDINNFVIQIVDPSIQNQTSIKQMFMKVFNEADLKNNGKVQYWGLYFIKNIQPFKDMVTYISQFEFEVQC